MELTAVEDKIITATVECIEKYGIKGTTIRQIAETAGVNIAAINYYFRSKDVLIDRVMKQTLHNAFDWEDIEKLPGSTANERCKAIFKDILLGGLSYPGITRAHFYDLMVEGNYQSLLAQMVNEFASNLVKDLKAKGSPLPEDELYLACIQITNAVLMYILMPKTFESKFGLDPQSPESGIRYINRLVDRLLG
jgi:AcrR family transcriptional regulator